MSEDVATRYTPEQVEQMKKSIDGVDEMSLERTNSIIEKYSHSPETFFQHFVKLPSLIDGIVPMIVGSFQQHFINHVESNRVSVISCDRQMGKTTACLAYCLWKMVFSDPGIGITYVSLNKNCSNKAKEMMQMMASLLPHSFYPNFHAFSDRSDRLVNMRHYSTINFLSPLEFKSIHRPDSFIDRSDSLVVLDEYAFFPSEFPTQVIDERINTESDSLPQLIIISSPKENQEDHLTPRQHFNMKVNSTWNSPATFNN